MNITLLEEAGINAQRLGPCPHIGERNVRRLLHHITQLTGQGQAATAGHTACLDKEDIAADRGDSQAGHDTRCLGPFGGFKKVALFAQQLGHIGAFDAHIFLYFPRSNPGGNLACGPPDLALQLAYTSFMGVVADDLTQGGIGKFDFALAQAVGAQLAWDQILARDMHLLRLDITIQPNDLHAVAQGGRDRVKQVGRGDKHHLGEIKVHI